VTTRTPPISHPSGNHRYREPGFVRLSTSGRLHLAHHMTPKGPW